MKTIDLPNGDGEFEEESYLALIVPGKTGFRYEAQVGGCACNHPAIEGAAIPLPDEFAREGLGALLYGEWGKYEPHDPDYDAELREVSRGHFRAMTRQEQYDFKKANPEAAVWCEAWIPVIVEAAEPERELSYLFAPFVGGAAVIVYPNSD